MELGLLAFFLPLMLFLFSCPVPSNSFATPWTAVPQASLSLAISQVCPSSHALHQWCHPAISSSDALFSFCLNLSLGQRLFQWVNCLHQMTKILEFQLQHQSFQRGLIFLKIDGFDLLAVQETFRSRQHHSPKASILWHSAFFTIQLSQPYMTTGKP